jgi:hypothetical protein
MLISHDRLSIFTNIYAHVINVYKSITVYDRALNHHFLSIWHLYAAVDISKISIPYVCITEKIFHKFIEKHIVIIRLIFRKHFL